ncbi:MAG: DUF971 domain-containing protein [Parachlamydiaceae bacterium]|nr:DUF971 domain-containing protein [Parachlamydiaceae bacterium]
MLRLAIRQIKQIDNHHFQIEWNDGAMITYHLKKLQKNCPCAGCVDESTGIRRSTALPKSLISEEVRARSINSVGRYALKVQFTSGCSAGIYDFAMLRTLG